MGSAVPAAGASRARGLDRSRHPERDRDLRRVGGPGVSDRRCPGRRGPAPGRADRPVREHEGPLDLALCPVRPVRLGRRTDGPNAPAVELARLDSAIGLSAVIAWGTTRTRRVARSAPVAGNGGRRRSRPRRGRRRRRDPSSSSACSIRPSSSRRPGPPVAPTGRAVPNGDHQWARCCRRHVAARTGRPCPGDRAAVAVRRLPVRNGRCTGRRDGRRPRTPRAGRLPRRDPG